MFISPTAAIEYAKDTAQIPGRHFKCKFHQQINRWQLAVGFSAR